MCGWWCQPSESHRLTIVIVVVVVLSFPLARQDPNAFSRKKLEDLYAKYAGKYLAPCSLPLPSRVSVAVSASSQWLTSAPL